MLISCEPARNGMRIPASITMQQTLASQLRTLPRDFYQLSGLRLGMVWHEPAKGRRRDVLPLLCPLARRACAGPGRLPPACRDCHRQGWWLSFAAGLGEQKMRGRCGAHSIFGLVTSDGTPLLTLVAQGRLAAQPPGRVTGPKPVGFRKPTLPLAPVITKEAFERAGVLLRLILQSLEATVQAANVLLATEQRLREMEKRIAHLQREPGRRGRDVPADPLVPDHAPNGRAACRTVQTMLDFIHCHFHRPMTLGELAARLHKNADYLAHIFSLNVGVTFSRYLLELRLAKAEELLRDPRACVCEVAAAVGFASADHFRHAFKAHAGASPSAWREAET